MKKLFLGEHGSKKTLTIKNYYLNLVNNGVSSSDIIVFVRNKTLENNLRESIYQESANSLEQVNIFRFRSFVNYIINSYWYLLLKKSPVFIGFSESILLMQEFIKLHPQYQVNFDKTYLIKLFERQQRRAENALTFEELKYRTMKIDDSTLAKEADLFLEKYNDWLIERDSPFFDYAVQLDFFLKLVNIPQVKEYIANSYKHSWIIEDVEDSIPVEHNFYEQMWSGSTNFIYTGNPYGGIRQFLGSDPEYIEELKVKVDEVINLESDRDLPLTEMGKHFYDDLVSYKVNNNSIDFICDKFAYKHSASYSQMLNELNTIWNKLKSEGVSPNDILVITNKPNEQFNLEVNSQLKYIDWQAESVKGSHIIASNPLINVLITFLRIIFYKEIEEDQRITPLTAFDFCQLLHIVGNVDNFHLAKLRRKLKNDTEAWINFVRDFSQKEGYKTLKVIHNVLTYSFEQKTKLAKATDYADLLSNICRSLLWNSSRFRDKSSLRDFKIFQQMMERHLEIKYLFSSDKPILDFINQIIKGELSDNPDREIEFDSDKIKIITAQKLAEIKYSTPIQIWIDITSDRWIQTEVNPIINAKLISKRWEIYQPWSFRDEDLFLRQNFARMFRINTSLCQKQAFFLSSEFGIMGENQNFEIIKNFLDSCNKSKKEHEKIS